MSIVEKLFGNLPDGWIIARLSSYLKNEKNSIKAGPFGSHLTNTDMQGSDIKVYNQRTVLDNDFINGDYYISEEKFEELKGFIVEPNDMLVTTRGTIGKCVIVPENVEVGILHPCLIKMKISEQKINPNYLQYIFNNTNIVKEQVQFLSNSTTIDVIYTQTLKDINFTLPVNIVDQNKIVSYLDKKVTEIDLLISKKELKVNLLQQQRQSIVTEAVTKGLNPNVKMKDSGVEWIGEIPEHWIKTKFKYITNKIIDGTHSTPNYTENGVPFLRVTDITQSKGKEINLENVKYISEEEHRELVKRCNPEKGDLLVSKNGTIGVPKVITWDWEFSIFVSLCLIKLKQNKINPFFASYFFESDLVEEQIAFGTKKSTIMNLHLEKVKEFFAFLPPLEEQLNIIEYLNEKAGEYSNLIGIQNKQIEKLKEYRQSLIYEAVTGKIDVRDMELD